MRFTIATVIAALSLRVLATPIVSSSLDTRIDPASSVTIVTGAVSTLNVSVNVNLQVVVAAVASNPSISVVPLVRTNIAKITTSFNKALATIIPVTFAGPVLLAEAQIDLLVNSIQVFNALVLNLKTQFDYILATVQQEALFLIKAQLQTASTIASALATNYVNSVTDIINAIVGLNSQILSEVQQTIQNIQTATYSLLYEVQ